MGLPGSSGEQGVVVCNLHGIEAKKLCRSIFRVHVVHLVQKVKKERNVLVSGATEVKREKRAYEVKKETLLMED